MRFMILVNATEESEAGILPTDEHPVFADMAAYHEELARAGVLLDASGLAPTSQGWRVRYEGDRRTVVDGPFTESKELVAGYTIIQTSSREEAIEWSRRFPNPTPDGRPCHVEVRRLLEVEDFEPGEAVDRFKKLNEEQGR